MVSLLTHICIARPQWVQAEAWKTSHVSMVPDCNPRTYLLWAVINLIDCVVGFMGRLLDLFTLQHKTQHKGVSTKLHQTWLFGWCNLDGLGQDLQCISNAIWWQRTGSTLAQVMACCLTAPSHYLNQCWLIISKVQQYSSDFNFTWESSAINHWNKLDNHFI